MEWYRTWVGGTEPLHVMDSIMDDAWCLGHEGDADPVAACHRRLSKILASAEGGLQWKDGSDGGKNKTVLPTTELPICGWQCHLKEKWISIPIGKRQKIRAAIKEAIGNRAVSHKLLSWNTQDRDLRRPPSVVFPVEAPHQDPALRTTPGYDLQH